jgi:hypothetical protein
LPGIEKTSIASFSMYSDKDGEMNERINGLWWKARIGYNNQNCDPEVLEKFAELIVRECAEFVRYKAEKSMSQEILYVGNDLLTHFGVEE